MSSNLPRLQDIVPESELSVQARRLIDYASKKHARFPKSLDKQTITEQFHSVFKMIGGVPRFALWADENPKEFFQMYSKLLPATLKAEMLRPPEDRDVKQMTLKELEEHALQEITRLKESVLSNPEYQAASLANVIAFPPNHDED